MASELRLSHTGLCGRGSESAYWFLVGNEGMRYPMKSFFFFLGGGGGIYVNIYIYTYLYIYIYVCIYKVPHAFIPYEEPGGQEFR